MTALTFDPYLPCVELLPSRAGSIKGAGLSWLAAAFTLRLTTDRRTDRRYSLRELPVDRAHFHGRGFELAKLTEGSDPEATSYTLLVSDRGPASDSCECRGFLRHGHCSHLDGVRAILANGWLIDPAELPAEPEVTPVDVDAMATHYGAE